MSVFGFSTEPSSGDFMPIVKYDARAGRLFRVDRVDTGTGFENDPIDITSGFKALVDFENIEVGWIDFSAGSPPNFVLVKLGEALPPRPSDRHKNGIRVLLKLAKNCGGEKPIREIAGTAKVFLNGVEMAYSNYLKERASNPNKLPIIALEKTTPIKSGSGDKQSTNYQPSFAIVGWARRGDLKFTSKNNAADPVVDPLPKTPPATGATKVEAPAGKAALATADDDFG